MQESLDRIVSCVCYYNPDCFFCGGNGLILESVKRKIMYKKDLQIFLAEKEFIKDRENKTNFHERSDKVLPQKVSFIIKEFKYTGDPKERVASARLRTEKGTIDYALGTSINSLLNTVEDIYASKYFKNKQFHIDVVIDSKIEPLTKKTYKKDDPLRLMNDVVNYFKNKFGQL